jgi:CRP-like cAMP-binding protein
MTPRQDEILRLLDKGEWFGRLPLDLRRTIVENSRTQRFSRGAMVRTEGSPPAGPCAVLEGTIAVARWCDADDHSLLHVGGPGFWFGEVAPLLRCESVVTIFAQTDVEILELPLDAFDRLVQERPDHYPHFARLAIERYVLLMRQMAEVLGLDKEALLRARLADLIDLRRLDDPHSDADIHAPQADLAALMGVSRQTLNELLKRLEASGAIEVSYRKIRVLDLERLRGDRSRTEIFRPLRALS